MKYWWAAVTLCLMAPAAASDVSDAVQQWMGKWPAIPFNRQASGMPQSKSTGPDGRTFFQYPGVRAGLEAAIGKARTAVLIGRWHTGGPLSMVERRWATFSVCMPHNCGNNQAEVFIDMPSGRFNVCWTQGAQSRWLPPAGPAIPSGASRCNSEVLYQQPTPSGR